MSSRGIHIGKVSLRLKGVTQQRARQMADAIGREIAQGLAQESPRLAHGKTEIAGFSLRLEANKKGPGIVEQIRKQWDGKRPRK
jgi:hypothetical protein